MIELKGQVQPVKELFGKISVGASGGALHAKTVIPTTETQEIVPDLGYYGLSSVTVKGLPSAEDNTFGGDEENEQYIIQGQTLTDIADQVQRICETENTLTPEQMRNNLMNITKGSDLPNAEDASFGSVGGEEHGILTTGKIRTNAGWTNTMGWKITAGQAFSVVGLRHKYDYNNKIVRLWDESGTQVASAQPNVKASDGWFECYLDTPIDVAVGEVFTIGCCHSDTYYITTSEATFNTKFSSVVGMRKYGSDAFPNEVSTYPSGLPTGGIVDVIIAPVDGDLPNDYQITRDTMDDIAKEVQRITGVTEKMTTTQIITALQGM